MKTKLLLTLFLCFTQLYVAQNVNIPDSNFKNSLLTEHNIDLNQDGEISITEASAYTRNIRVRNRSISDLTGIEAFTNIIELNCRDNQISTLNISLNKALTKLECNNNKLTVLDVSNNIALEGLMCDNNKLIAIDLSKNIALRYVWCQGNLLTSIDVSNNSALIQLFCSNNQLTRVNLANGNNAAFNTNNFSARSNPDLTCIQIDAGFTPPSGWGKDPIASFSNNCNYPCIVNILDTNFKDSLLANTNINTNGNTEIECSEASNYTGDIRLIGEGITNLKGLEAFTSLRIFEFENDPLTTIDLSSNTALERLSLNETQITTLDLSSNINLETLAVFKGNLTTLDVSSNLALKDIRVVGQQITDIDLSNNPALIDVRFSDNNLSSFNIANGNNTAITRFDVALNSNLSCVQIDNGFTPNNNWLGVLPSIYSTNCNATANVIDTLFNSIIKIYPNPIKNTLTLTLGTGQNLKKIQIFTLLGKKILETNNTVLNLSNVLSGVYILKVENTEGKIAVRKIIKE